MSDRIVTLGTTGVGTTAPGCRLACGRRDTITIATKFATRLARCPRTGQGAQKAPQLSLLILDVALIASWFIVAEGL